jgi:hypothetical protein
VFKRAVSTSNADQALEDKPAELQTVMKAASSSDQRSNFKYDHPWRLNFDVTVSVVHSLTKCTCQGKCTRGSQADILGFRPLEKQDWYLSLGWSSENTHTQEIRNVLKLSVPARHWSISARGYRTNIK